MCVNKSDSLIVMSFRLPVVVIRKKDGSFKLEDSKSLLYPTIFKLKNHLNFQWIGWPGIIPKNEDEKLRIRLLLAGQKCIPIFLELDNIILYQLFIDKFLNTMFHNFKGSDADDLDILNSHLWHAY